MRIRGEIEKDLENKIDRIEKTRLIGLRRKIEKIEKTRLIGLGRKIDRIGKKD